MNPLLEVLNLSVGYAGSPVCGPLSTAIHSGYALGLIGRNGAGKSTVARTVVGLQASLGGKVLFSGTRLDERSLKFRKEVSMVFDEDAFFPWLTVSEHLNLVVAGHGLPISAIDRELAFFGLTDHSDAFPHTLSSGQRRRLLLAAALIRPAKLLVLDEPEQRLDPQMRDKLGSRIRDQVSAGQAAVIITHDSDLLLRTVDHCILVDSEVKYLSPSEGAHAIAAD